MLWESDAAIGRTTGGEDAAALEQDRLDDPVGRAALEKRCEFSGEHLVGQLLADAGAQRGVLAGVGGGAGFELPGLGDQVGGPLVGEAVGIGAEDLGHEVGEEGVHHVADVLRLHRGIEIGDVLGDEHRAAARFPGGGHEACVVARDELLALIDEQEAGRAALGDPSPFHRTLKEVLHHRPDMRPTSANARIG